jgi:hypothetical protein
LIDGHIINSKSRLNSMPPLNESEMNYVVQVLEDLQAKRMITFDVPEILQYRHDDDDTIDFEDIDTEVVDIRAAA